MSGLKKSVIPLFAAIAVALCLCLSLHMAVFVRAHAAESVQAEFLRPDDAPKYFYLDEPNGIAADTSKLYVTSCNNEIYSFKPDGTYEQTTEVEVTPDKLVTLKSEKFILSSGTVYLGSAALIDGVTDFACDGYNLYILKESELLLLKKNADEDGAEGYEAELLKQLNISYARNIAASDGAVFVAADSGRNAFQSNIYRIDTTTLAVENMLSKTEYVTDMAALGQGSLVLLQNGVLKRYDDTLGKLKLTSVSECGNLRALAILGENVYALGGDGSIVRASADLKEYTYVLASISDSDWFYSSPISASTRRDYVLVADSGNDRIVKITGSGFTAIEPDVDIPSPTAAVADYFGNTFVAYGYGKIVKLNKSYKEVKTFALPTGVATLDLKLNPLSGALYILGSNGSLYTLDAGEDELKERENVDVDAIAVSVDGSKVYGADFSENKIFDLASLEVVKTLTSPTLSFTVDMSGSFYALTESGEIICYPDSGEARTVAGSDSGIVPGADHITLSTVKNELIGYGDIIITNSTRHCVQKIAADSAGVKVTGDDFTVPEWYTSAEANEKSELIVRHTIADAEVYSRPIDMNSSAYIATGSKVIVIDYEAFGAFSFVLCDSVTGGSEHYGYVLRALLSDPTPYSAPSKTKANIFAANTAVYKYPSHNSEHIDTYGSGTSFDLLDFVWEGKNKDGEPYYGMTDDCATPCLWYRVAVDDNEGYIPSTSVTLGKYSNQSIYPQTNATVIAETGAPMYEIDDDGNIVLDENDNPVLADDQPLKNGTRVEVIGVFDGSQKYTRIAYYDEVYRATREGYVETQYLKYDGIGLVIVIVVILTILATLGVIATIVWHHYAKKKKMTKA